jgi:molybdopterin synthase catalytic subunit
MSEEARQPPQVLREGDSIHVELAHDRLDVQTIINRVKSPKAGAIVLFAGQQDPALLVSNL